MNKIFWSELDVRAARDWRSSCSGRTRELVLEAPRGRRRRWMKGYEFALAGPIYAGTNEIQRNVVAERVLGLPRQLSRCTSPSPTSSSRSATPSGTS